MAQTSATRPSGRRPVVAVDRLSSLPDVLLHAIMSFLTVRQAVRTCVLSRRWEDLWCSMPCLHIDQREFPAAESHVSALHDWETFRSSPFANFVDNLLTFHRAPLLETFRILVTQCYHPVGRWLRRGIKYCPEVAEICFPTNDHSYELPHWGSSSSRLKRLHLAGVYFNKKFTLHLRSGCPVLQDLVLERCLVAYPEIMSCSLKNLIIIDCSIYEGNELTVTARALVSFHLDIAVGWTWKGIFVNDMPSLVKASICLKYHLCVGRKYPKGPCKLLCSLINVRNLEISGSDTLSILHEGSDTFPTFSSLRTLLFDECYLSDNFQILGCFLNNAPSLEKLTLQYCQVDRSFQEKEKKGRSKEDTSKMSGHTRFPMSKLEVN